MLKVLKRGLFLSVMALGLAVAIQSFSYATPLQISLTDSVTLATVTVNDGGIGDANPMPGMVTFIGPVGNWIANVTTGTTYPVLGSQSNPNLDLGSVNISSQAPGTLSIGVSALDYTRAPGPVTFQIGGTTAGNVKAKAFSGDNSFFSNLNEFASLSFNSTPFAGSASGSIPGSPNPYSLSMVVDITHTSAGVTSFDAQTTAAVPEPATMFLLGSGLIGLAGLARKRFLKK